MLLMKGFLMKRKPTKENCIGRVMKFKNNPNSTIFVVVGSHPADFVPHIYWNAPGFSTHAADLNEIEFCKADTQLTDARPNIEKGKPWTVEITYPTFRGMRS